MSKTFTDDSTGEKWVTQEIQNQTTPTLIIKPLEVKKEWRVTIEATWSVSPRIEVWWDNQEQAEALREAVNELMEYVTGGVDWTPDFDKLIEARAVFQEGN